MPGTDHFALLIERKISGGRGKERPAGAPEPDEKTASD